MITEKELIKLSRSFEKARYFVIMYAGNEISWGRSDFVKERAYLHGEIVHISKCGNYPKRRSLIRKIQKADGVFNVSITNIIELSRADFKTWVSND